MANPQHSQHDQLGMVAEFCTLMEQPVSLGWEPAIEQGRLELGKRLIAEEFREVMEALADVCANPTDVNKEHLTKELTDLLYVTNWTGATIGLDLNTAFKLVHISNLSKLDLNNKPVKNEFGKVIKGPYYIPPDLSSVAKAAPVCLA